VTPDKLNVGDCIESLPADEVIITVHVVPCSELHGGRVFATFELPGGKWPGEAEVNASADAGCTSRFDASGEHADQLSEIVYLAPLERGWRLGDREVLCFLVPAG
jgi:Septum formation